MGNRRNISFICGVLTLLLCGMVFFESPAFAQENETEEIIIDNESFQIEASNYGPACVRISWDSVGGTETYAVYRKENEKDFEEIATTTETIWFDENVEIDQEYVYYVESIQSYEEAPVTSSEITIKTSLGKTITTSAIMEGANVTVKWDKFSGASGYRVFRREVGYSGLWDILQTIPGEEVTEFTDTTVPIGKEYTYTVRAYVEKNEQTYWTDFNTNITCDTSQAPSTTTVAATLNGANIVVNWNAYPGANGYRIYRREVGYSGLWDILGTVQGENVTSYVDTTAPIGKNYTYTVRAYVTRKDQTFWSDFNTNITCDTSKPEAAKTVSAELNGTNVIVKWVSYPGATGYRIYRREVGNTGLWDILKTVQGESATSFIDNTAPIGKKNTYTVRAYAERKGETFWSDFNTDVICDTSDPQAAKTISAVMQGAGVVVRWDQYPGATGYRIYRREVGYTGLWDILETIKDEKTTSFTDNTETIGKKYTYTVRAYSERKDQVFWSEFNTDIICDTSNPEPTKTLSATLKGADVVIKWKAYPGASGYRIYRREVGNTGLWDILKTIPGEETTSYTDKTETIGKKYTYTVRAYADREDQRFWADFNTDITCDTSIIEAAKTVSATMSGANVVVRWNVFPGADSYRIYRREVGNTGLWDVLKTVQGENVSSYTDNSEEIGKKYTYTVRAHVTRKEQSYWSDFNTNIVCDTSKPDATKTVSAKMSGTNVIVKWNVYPGAAGYRIYRREVGNSGLWDILGTISGENKSSFEDKTAESGKDYNYTVRAYVTRNGQTFWSDFNYDVHCKVVMSAPKLTGLMPAGTNHMEVKWSSVDYADGYYIYRKEGNGSWKKVGSVNSRGTTSFLDSSCEYGKTYTYSVRAYKDKSKKVLCGWDEKGITAKLSYKSRYVDGFKLYYDDNGNLIKDVDHIIGKQSSYKIVVYREACVTTVYAKDGSRGYIIPVKSFICSPGEGTNTPIGTFYTPAKYRWKLLIGPVYGQWSTRIWNGILFHTVYYYTDQDNTSLSVSRFNRLGTKDSMGCVRLTCGDAKWIYDNCAIGTQVQILNSSYTGPFGKPSSVSLPSWHTWDPTDPNCRYLCEKNNCH